MLIERTNKEVIIRLSASVNTDDLQDMVDYVRYKEITSKFKASQKSVDKLADDVNKSWWAKNRKRLVK
jgi:dihydroneopterin aldolase